MAITPVDFVADQLKAAAPNADWQATGVDRAREMAGVLVDNGIVDLSKLHIVPREYIARIPDHWTGGDAQYIDVYAHDETAQGIALEYNGRLLGYLGGPGDTGAKQPTDPVLIDGTLGPGQVAWSPYGHGHVDYYVRQSGNGFAIVPVWQSSSDAGFIREGLIGAATFMIQFALPLGGVNVAQVLGSKILGAALAAAYPALTAVVGNVALGTVFSGGNVAQAVKLAAAGYVGGVVGGGIGSATKLDYLGKVTAAATSAAISGGNVDRAIITALAGVGAKSMNEILENPMPPQSTWFSDSPAHIPVDPYGIGSGVFDNVGGPVLNDPAWDIGPLFTPDPSIPDTTGTSPVNDPLFPGGITESPPASAFYTDIPTFTIAPDGTVASNSGVNLQGITNAALAAVQIIRAFQGSGGVVQNPTAANRAASSSSGLVVTRNTNGTLTQQRPAVGVATVTSDGGLVVNNGNGTFDYVDATGGRSTRSYPPSGTSTGTGAIAGIPANTLLLVGGGLLALLMLNKGK